VRLHARGLPITLDVEGARVVVLGDGEASDRRVAFLRECGAEVVRASDVVDSELDGAKLAMLCTRDPVLAEKLHAATRARGILCWCEDDPPHSDLAMPAVAQLGDARITISTAGHSPALAGRLRAAFESGFDDRLAAFVAALGELREQLTQTEPDPERRREQLQRAVDGFTVELTVAYPAWFRPR